MNPVHPIPQTKIAAILAKAAFLFSSLLIATAALGQGSAALGNGLSAAATARGGATVTERGNALDAVQGNPAGLAGLNARTLDAGALALVATGSFNNSVNHNAKLTGVAGALPFGAVATPIGKSPWVVAAAFTPEILIRANWHYNDAPGTAGVTYGYQTQETQIIAVRSSLSAARSFGPKWSAGASLGIVYNQNELNAPYIFQQEPHLAGLKVLLNLKTHGYGWNGGAGVQYFPTSRIRTAISWKSGTTIHTNGNLTGSASALFNALGVPADPTFAYKTQVMNHLPQIASAGLSWQTRSHVTLSLQGDFTNWHSAFAELPITVTQGTNAVVNSVVGADNFKDAVPLHWRNQGTLHTGAEFPLTETVTLRGGYSYANDPVPSSTLIPLTAAIMQNSLAAGGGWKHKRMRLDAAYQVQLPSNRYVAKSGLQAGEYDNSSIRLVTQSLTLTAHYNF